MCCLPYYRWRKRLATALLPFCSLIDKRTHVAFCRITVWIHVKKTQQFFRILIKVNLSMGRSASKLDLTTCTFSENAHHVCFFWVFTDCNLRRLNTLLKSNLSKALQGFSIRIQLNQVILWTSICAKTLALVEYLIGSRHALLTFKSFYLLFSNPLSPGKFLEDGWIVAWCLKK